MYPARRSAPSARAPSPLSRRRGLKNTSSPDASHCEGARRHTNNPRGDRASGQRSSIGARSACARDQRAAATQLARGARALAHALKLDKPHSSTRWAVVGRVHAKRGARRCAVVGAVEPVVERQPLHPRVEGVRGHHAREVAPRAFNHPANFTPEGAARSVERYHAAHRGTGQVAHARVRHASRRNLRACTDVNVRP